MVTIRPLVLLALLLLMQLGPQVARASGRGDGGGCGAGPAPMSCCEPGHCPCASTTTEQAPPLPVIVPDGPGREWVAHPVPATLAGTAAPVVAPRPPACRATAPAVALSAVPVPRTVLLCMFLI